MLSGRGFCDELITRPEESYRLWRVVVCDQETSKTRRLKHATGAVKIQPQWVVMPGKQTNMFTVLSNRIGDVALLMAIALLELIVFLELSVKTDIDVFR